MTTPGYHDAAAAALRQLSPAQRRVLAMIVAGKLTKEIAEELHISEKGVEYHRHRIYTALGLRRVADAVRVAVQTGLG